MYMAQTCGHGKKAAKALVKGSEGKREERTKCKLREDRIAWSSAKKYLPKMQITGRGY